MRMMISGATTTVEELVQDQALVPYLGGMVTPTTGNSLARVCSFGVPYCLDNSSFAGNKQGFNASAFVALMQKAADAPRKPVFACVPDVVHLTPEGPVGDHRATIASFWKWVDRLLPFGVPLAFVAQDGMDYYGIEDDIPWSLINAVFIGGSDEFKETMTIDIAAACHRHGKWCHLGRVNGRQRLRLALHCGCDSVDGSSLSRFARTWMPVFARHLVELEQEGAQMDARIVELQEEGHERDRRDDENGLPASRGKVCYVKHVSV